MNRWAGVRVRSMTGAREVWRQGSVFLRMDQAKSRAREAGLAVIDLSIGASDLRPPRVALQALRAAADDPSTYGYCLKSATLPFLSSAVRWYARRFGPRFDPKREALTLIGSQEGLMHLLLAVADPGQGLLLPEVAYPSYWGAAAVAGMPTFEIPLGKDGLPELSRVPEEALRTARVLLLNYPNNPTAVMASRSFFLEALAFAKQHDLLLVHDHPYVDQVFEGEPQSPLALPGAEERVVELFSFSKSYHMGGFRLGFALGNAEAIAALEAIKAPTDFNQYLGVLRMGIAALEQAGGSPARDLASLRERRDALIEALGDVGWVVPPPSATMYVWAKLPSGTDDLTFALKLLAEAGVALAPGQAFGPGGSGYLRFALVRGPAVLREAARRIGRMLG